ncbi:MAG: hypothetical protein IKR48_03985 [Kiritimatiellae bacterium]|jgi:hypothetical protein|nr:hypothetical protein [Kiritimatiellia bacterium]
MAKEKDYREQIDRSVKRLAKALNLIEAMRDELQFVFEQTEWNDEVKYQIDEAAAKLGFSLATLSTWYDDAEE